MKKIFAILLLFFICNRHYAQDKPVIFNQKEAETELNKLDEKARRKKIIQWTSDYLQSGDPNATVKFLDFAIRYVQLHDQNTKLIGDLYLRRGQTHRKLHKISLAMNDLLKAEDIFINSNNIVGLQEVCLAFSNLYQLANDNVNALKFALRAKDYAIKTKSDESLGNVYNSIANLYFTQHQHEQAFMYYRRSIALLKKKKNKIAEAYLLDNIAMVWTEIGDSASIDSAYHYNQQALKIAYEIKDPYLELQLMPSAGVIAEARKEYDRQMAYALRAKKLSDSLGIETFVIYSDLNYASALNRKNKSREAVEVLRRCINQLKPANDYHALSSAYDEMFKSFESLKQYDSAFFYFKLSGQVEDTLEAIRAKDKVNEIFAKVELDQKEEKIENLNKLNAALKEKDLLNDEKDRLKSIMLYGAIALLLVIAVLLVVTFKRFRDNKKLSAEIIVKNQALVTKNNEITDSINYAKRIQQALLPAENDLVSSFRDSFILYKPKDIVSGDFYWVHREKDLVFLAVGDCTGHGVPGGFMSMLGHSFLNEVVNERGIRQPAEVLNQLREKVISSLRQKGAAGENKDGMDIALVLIDKNARKLHYAAANNSFYLVRNNALTEYKADKQPIGYYSSTMRPFTQHTVDVMANDAVYLFTDGYPDQFGGSKGKKFKYSNLQQRICAISSQAMQQQHAALLDTFNSWKGAHEQTDDVCIVGLRL